MKASDQIWGWSNPTLLIDDSHSSKQSRVTQDEIKQIINITPSLKWLCKFGVQKPGFIFHIKKGIQFATGSTQTNNVMTPVKISGVWDFVDRSCIAIVRIPQCKCCISFWVPNLRRILTPKYVSRRRDRNGEESRTPVTGNTCRNKGYLAGGEHWRESKIPVLDKLKPSHEEGMSFLCAAKLEQWVKVAKSYYSS